MFTPNRCHILFTLFACTAAAQPVQTDSDPDIVRSTRHLSHVGVTVVETKEIDPLTGVATHSATTPDGTRVDLGPLLREERRLALASRDRVSPALRQRMTESVGPFDVGLWFDVDVDESALDEVFRSERAAGASPRAARRALLESLRMSNAAATAEAQSELSRLGVELRYACRYAPLVFVRTDAAGVEGLAAWRRTRAIDVSRQLDAEGLANSSIKTHRWDRVRDFGIDGTGVRVAVVEADAVTASAGSKLNVVAWKDPVVVAGPHASGIAGIIGARSATFPGYAPGCEILSANDSQFPYLDSDQIDGFEWSLDNGADIINLSLGTDIGLSMGLLDRYVDHVVRHARVTVVKSAGNKGAGTGNVTSPGLAWNCITVGNIDDSANADWDDDTMAPASSYKDPSSPHNDRQKPELAAVGTQVLSLSAAGEFDNGVTGTSYAAPVVAGVAAALMQDGGVGEDLRAAPEVVKAILMAGATNNVEGSSSLSDKDGAGGLNGVQCYRMLEQRRFEAGTFDAASFVGSNSRTVELKAFDRARVALCWNSDVSQDYLSDDLASDFDLYVYRGSGTGGTLVAKSLSWDNSYELVEFVPPVTDTYTIRVVAYNLGPNPERYGIAWTQQSDGRHARIAMIPEISSPRFPLGPTPDGSVFPFRVLDAVNPGHGFYYAVANINSTGVHLTGRRSDPNNSFLQTLLGFDAYGVLGATGQATALLPFINYYNSQGFQFPVALQNGAPLYITAWTLDANHPNGVKELTFGEELRVWDAPTDLQVYQYDTKKVSLGFTFPYYGKAYTECWVNTDGTVTFGEGDLAHVSPDIVSFQSGLPRIALLNADLNPNSGKLRVRRAAGRIAIEFWSATVVGSGGYLSAYLTLDQSGAIDMYYGKYIGTGAGITDSVIGISSGEYPLTFQEVDLSRGLFTAEAGYAIYEHFQPGTSCDLLSKDGQSLSRMRFEPIDATFKRYQMTVDLTQ